MKIAWRLGAKEGTCNAALKAVPRWFRAQAIDSIGEHNIFAVVVRKCRETSKP